MFFASILVAALVGVAQAQTPKGFTPSVNSKLDVLFNSTAVSEPGKLLTKASKNTLDQSRNPSLTLYSNG